MFTVKSMSRIYRRGKAGMFTYQGHGLKKSMGTNNETIANEIKRKWDERLERSAHGLQHLNMTWGEYRAEYDVEYQVNAENSGLKMKICLNHFERLVGINGNSKMSSIRIADCKKWAALRLQEVLPQTVESEMKYLAPFFESARQRGYIESNPFIEVKCPRFVRPEAKCLNPQEVFNTLQAIQQHYPERWLLVIFAYETGMRLEEILHQRIEDVDFVKGMINIKKHAALCRCFACLDGAKKGKRPGWEPKGRQERSVPIMPRLLSLLLEFFQSQQSDIIFKFQENTVRRTMKRGYKKAGVTGKVAVHTLRHTLNNDLRLAGVDKEVRSAIVGHGKTSINEVYTHVMFDEMRAAMKSLWEWRTGIGSQMVAHIK